jgi:hypothetical protein
MNTCDTLPDLAAGDLIQITDARPYTDNGRRGLHVMTWTARITHADDFTVTYVGESLDVDEDRPAFAPRRDGAPLTGRALTWAAALYLERGEWQKIPTPTRPLLEVLAEHVAEVTSRRIAEARS